MSNLVRTINPKTLYYFPKPNRWQKGIGAALPQEYNKFWREWKLTNPEPVHYIPTKGRYCIDKNGEIKRVQNIPLPLIKPNEYHQGIWGGEAIVQGFVKKAYNKRRVPKFWVPTLKQSVVYSEVLDKYMSVTVTRRALDLIHENYGFDFYLLNTKACNLGSELALKLKRQILIALYDKTLYPDDPVKREEVYKKYEKYLSEFTREEIEWYGLSWKEAVKKYLEINREKNVPVPLKGVYREKLIQQLKLEDKIMAEQKQEERPRSWISKLNPFSNKESTT